jgi:YD repeat-containing protein
VDSKEHLVEGALLVCLYGDKEGRLTLPKGHGMTIGERKVANQKDCIEGENIPYFGSCERNEQNKKCKGFMDLEEQWEEIAFSKKETELLGGEKVLHMNCVLFCKRKGIIFPWNSGQGNHSVMDWASFLQRMERIRRWALGKDPNWQIFGKDPVNLNTGNFIYEKEGLVIPGRWTLSFCLFYNSMDIGEGWHHNHEIFLKEEGRNIKISLWDGNEISYERGVGDTYSPLFGDLGILRKEEDGYFYDMGEKGKYWFNKEGNVVMMEGRDGERKDFTYNEKGKLERVDSLNGGSLFYTYNNEGNIIPVEDHTGRKIQLWYQYGKLVEYINEEGKSYYYGYNENGKVDSVKTPGGIIGVRNEYDGADRVVRQIPPDRGIVEFAYDDMERKT